MMSKEACTFPVARKLHIAALFAELADSFDRQRAAGIGEYLSIWLDFVSDGLQIAEGRLPCEWLLAACYSAFEDAIEQGGSAIRKFKVENYGDCKRVIGFHGPEFQSLLNLSFERERDLVGTARELWLRFSETGSIDALAYILLSLQETENKDIQKIFFSRQQFDYLHEIVVDEDFSKRPLRVRGVLLMAWLKAILENQEFISSKNMSKDAIIDYAMQNGATEHVRARQSITALLTRSQDYQSLIKICDVPFDDSLLNEQDQYFCSNWSAETSPDVIVELGELAREYLKISPSN